MSHSTPEQRKKWRQENSNHVKKYSKAWREKNSKIISEYRKKIRKLPEIRFHQYRYGAKSRGYSFDITKEEFINIVSLDCHYCGSPEHIGIDRKDNSIGYTKENSLPCCWSCNKMKTSSTYEDFIKQCIKIANNKEEGRNEN